MLVGLDRIAGQEGNGFLMGWSEDKVRTFPVFEFVEVIPVGVITARFPPNICGQEGWGQKLYRTNLIKLLAHDGFSLFNNPVGKWQIAINSS